VPANEYKKTEIFMFQSFSEYERFAGDIEIMLGFRPNIFWKVCWLGLTPAVIVVSTSTLACPVFSLLHFYQVTIVFNCIFYKEPTLDDYTFPEWAKSLGWMIALFPMLLIPLWFGLQFCYDGGFTVSPHLPLVDHFYF
jgi:hypothetical protein